MYRPENQHVLLLHLEPRIIGNLTFVLSIVSARHGVLKSLIISLYGCHFSACLPLTVFVICNEILSAIFNASNNLSLYEE
jgi:hypothetical protein